MTVCFTEHCYLNRELFKKHGIDILDDPDIAEFVIAQINVKREDLLHKTAYIGIEPPIAPHRIWCYENFDKFKLVVTYNPDPSKSNQIPFTSNDEAQYSPIATHQSLFMYRESTVIRNRGVFFAGNIQQYACDGNPMFGGMSINFVRKPVCDALLNKFPESVIIGRGWNGKTEKIKPGWRTEKIKIIMESNTDFVLALENTIYPNYITEKIWDGFAADKVTLYLGDPNVHKHVPLNCFIDLRQCYDMVNARIDIPYIIDKVGAIKQEEYDFIISNARTFRKTCIGKYYAHIDDLTRRVIRNLFPKLP